MVFSWNSHLQAKVGRDHTTRNTNCFVPAFVETGLTNGSRHHLTSTRPCPKKRLHAFHATPRRANFLLSFLPSLHLSFLPSLPPTSQLASPQLLEPREYLVDMYESSEGPHDEAGRSWMGPCFYLRQGSRPAGVRPR